MKEVLVGAMDEDTLDQLEIKYPNIDKTTYKEVKAWIVTRSERNASRKDDKKGKNDMDVSGLQGEDAK